MGEGGKKKTAELGGRDQECRFSLSVRSAGEVRESHAVIRVQCRGGHSRQRERLCKGPEVASVAPAWEAE